MKAIVYQRYGSPEVLELIEVEKPTPKDNEVLIKVYAASVNSTDLGFLEGKPFVVRLMVGLLKPRLKILVCDISFDFRLQACTWSQGHLCHAWWRFLGSNLPNHVPGTIDFNDRE